MIDDPLIGRQLANFRLERAIGRGGMAQVYYGYDVKLKRPVAVKVIDARHRGKPAYARRFVREAQAIAQWRHEHIIQIYYADDKAGLYYFVMEYIDGQDLGRLLAQTTAKGRLLPRAEVLRIGQAIASALDYAHQRGVIHRDVKPSNVLLAKDGRVVLADFGLALEIEQGSMGEIMGSAHYLAPEQARHSAKAVPQSDLYALGVILYEMLTGRTPFNDPSPTTVAVQHLTLPPPPPRQFNPRLNKATEAVLLKALSKSPAERYQTGQALMAALTKALSPPETAPAERAKLPPAKAAPKASQRAAHPKLVYAGAGLLLILLVTSAAGFWLWRGESALNLWPAPAPTSAAGANSAANRSPARTPTRPAEAFAPPPITLTPAPALTLSARPTLTPVATSTPSLTPALAPTEAPAAPSPTSTLAPTSRPAPLGDTRREFSGVQGQSHWDYQWSRGRESFDWAAMQFDGACWRAPKVDGFVWEDYVRICSASAHPGLAGDITWRWTSEVSGPIQVEVSARKIDTRGGDGVVIVVYRNTEEIRRWSLEATDNQGFSQTVSLDIARGDYLFFVLKAGADATNDETAFQARIVTAQAQ